MKKLLTFLCAVTFVLGLAISSSATPIYYQAAGVEGTGTITYGYDPATINIAPEFNFVGSQGVVTSDFSSFTPGEYVIDFSLTGLEVDANEDGDWFDLDDYSYTSGPITLPFLPPATGTYGQLSWDVDLTSGFWVSYDFGTTGTYTNAGVNDYLAAIDSAYSGAANGIMNANIKWDNLRVELTPVPEPSTLLLLGGGLLGLGFARKRFARK